MTTNTDRPHVVCHMATSIDGRILPDRWRPAVSDILGVYEQIHAQLAGDAWIVGRTTGQEFAKAGVTYPTSTEETFPRTPWLPQRDAEGYGIVLDAHGKIAWGRCDIGGDPIVVVLTDNVPDAHLAGLRNDGVGYLFAGRDAIDIPVALRILRSELGIERLLLEGGGEVNGGFLRAGAVDEVSLLILPAVDGAKGAPSLFDSREGEDLRPDIRHLRLDSCEVLDGGMVWLRYVLNEAQG